MEADSIIVSQWSLASFSTSGWLDVSDNLSSTACLQLSFNCFPNTHFLLFLHDLCTVSTNPPIYYKQESCPTHCTVRWALLLRASGAHRENIRIIGGIHFVSSWLFWGKRHSKRQRRRPFLLTSCWPGLAYTESNDVWQPGKTTHTKLIKVMSGLAAPVKKLIDRKSGGWKDHGLSNGNLKFLFWSPNTHKVTSPNRINNGRLRSFYAAMSTVRLTVPHVGSNRRYVLHSTYDK